MLSINPLTLPELLSRIVVHLENYEIIICLRVCKLWHIVLLPLVWTKVDAIGVDMGRVPDGPSPEALSRHCDLVQVLSIFDNNPGIYNATFPNLRSLTFCSKNLQKYDITLESNPKHMIELNPTLNDLHIRLLGGVLSKDFWDAVADLPSLKKLRVRYSSLQSKDDVDAFWRACLHLETLCLVSSCIPASIQILENPNSPTFPRLRMLEIDLVNLIGYDKQLFIIRQCPLLEELVWNFTPQAGVLELFADDITRGIWPKLTKLSLGYSIPDAGLTRVISGIQYLDKLDMSCTGFGVKSFQSLGRHFNTLTELYLRESSGATSEILCEIMCSCPNLLEFQGGVILAKDILSYRPWACLSLKCLEVCFAFCKQEQDLQAAIFERLSKLIRLERLCVGGWASWKKRSAEEVLDMRLEKGLGVLERLWNMKYINVYNTTQLLEECDIRWMISKWKKLEEVRGQLNPDTIRDMSLIVLLQNHGIQTNDHLNRVNRRFFGTIKS